MEEKYLKVQEILKKHNQLHLLKNLDNLCLEKKEELLDSILKLDFETIEKMYAGEIKENSIQDIQPIKSIVKADILDTEKEKYENIGKEIITGEKFAIVTMAGGQGTRLGHTGPKGTYLVHLESGDKYIFEIFVDSLKKAYNKYNTYIPWYIMTSKENDKETKDFFIKNNYFGYPEEKIKFFSQGVLPVTDMSGNILLNSSSDILEAADGNGGIFKALDKNNIIKEMETLGIEWVQITGVDNILVNLVDELYIGLVNESKKQNGVKSIKKGYPQEKVGVFCKRNGKPYVIEYIEMTQEMLEKKDANGDYLYSDANFVNHLIHIDILNKIKETSLPIHKAKKKMEYIDINGILQNPTEPCLYKYETFIFDYFNMVEDCTILRVKREDEFAPIKNKEGVDSPETAVKLYSDYMKRCLGGCHE